MNRCIYVLCLLSVLMGCASRRKVLEQQQTTEQVTSASMSTMATADSSRTVMEDALLMDSVMYQWESYVVVDSTGRSVVMQHHGYGSRTLVRTSTHAVRQSAHGSDTSSVAASDTMVSRTTYTKVSKPSKGTYLLPWLIIVFAVVTIVCGIIIKKKYV